MCGRVAIVDSLWKLKGVELERLWIEGFSGAQLGYRDSGVEAGLADRCRNSAIIHQNPGGPGSHSAAMRKLNPSA